ncbi:alpha/beta hydrolase [Embleya scabrispora]|uniref:alpha/beta hydrolase n=1 Tax=Embleya scabrispora TaxID=159449 RepID=UPI00037C5E26|nr:alpha/beta hydrolase [Embleya scabrispora]MYS81481.1 alpha/beta hydrolase [Streptomyces sp. SID5474]
MVREEADGPAGIDRRRVIASAVPAAALLLAGGIARARPASARPVPARSDEPGPATDGMLRLTPPTGPYAVGTTTLYLVDRSRPDPWEPIPVREVMVTVFYPARTVRGCPVAPQLSAGAGQAFVTAAPLTHPQLPAAGVDWAATATHAYTNAPARTERRPVLLYSPGGGDPRGMGTGVAEELASRGYVVVSIDHSGDGAVVEFPVDTQGRDDRVRWTVLRFDPRTDPGMFRTMIDTRIADTRFVLDRLTVLAGGGNPDPTGAPLPDGLHRALDLRRVGVYGHSAGGTTAAETMYEDRRIAAAINLEGYLDHPSPGPGRDGELYAIARDGTDRPLLLLGTDGFTDRRNLDRSWSALRAHSRRPVPLRRVEPAAHHVFTDHAVFAPRLQAAGLMSAADRIALIGPIDPAVSVPTVRRYIHAFFARHLPTH